MQNDELISVILPVYKSEEFLHKCVSSIQSQMYSNLEIILVNDGSPDGSGALCDDFAKTDPRIRVLHKPNGGAANAINTGLELASGEYVAFINHDDTIDKDMLERLHDSIISVGADVAVSGFRMLHEGYERIVRVPCTGVLSNLQYWEAYMKDPRNICFLVGWNKLIKRELLTKASIRYREDITAVWDMYFSAQCCTAAENGIVFVDFTPYNFANNNPNSLGKSDKYYEERCDLVDYLCDVMLSSLPEKADEIAIFRKCQKCIALTMARHVAIISKAHNTSIKLTAKIVASILRYSSSFYEKVSALLMYCLPASFYRWAYKLYCKFEA